jgi:hypothetical protein
MRKRQNCPRKAGRPTDWRGKLGRLIIGACLLALPVGLNAGPARADDAGDSPSGWSKFMQFMGLKQSNGNTINYTERAPLVVPPSRDLPAPVNDGSPPADWPKDPAQHAKTAKPKDNVVPGTAVQTPNPAWQKKPWYNPAGWFDKEEYANFNGEPVRQSLTDPPAGYRVPSAEQPYGIAPDKKATKATAQDLGLTSVMPPAGH